MKQQLEIDYENPLPIISVVFNPHNFKSRYRLYHEFKKYLSNFNVKLLTVEVAFNDRPFQCTSPDDPWNIQLRSKHVIWLKERMINIGVKKLYKLMPNWKNFSWLDADIMFTNPHWVQDAQLAMDHYDVVQMYSQAAHLNQDWEIEWFCRCVFYDYIHKRGFHQDPPMPMKYFTGGHPGLAWGMTRKAYEALGGLIDITISGSGDLMMANALMGDVMHGCSSHVSEGFKKALKDWQRKADVHIRGNVGYVKGTVMDAFHGFSETRGYNKRWDIMSFHSFDPRLDIFEGENGLWEFTGNKPKFEQDLRLSTLMRNEDASK